MRFAAYRCAVLLYSRCHPRLQARTIGFHLHESHLFVQALKVQRGVCTGPHEDGPSYESELVNIDNVDRLGTALLQIVPLTNARR
ncbi:uncharacterized protein TRAVEDRAFT_30321 [Trametes versicolor FP-101664 SS1]|uniref:uncharacterized protein n=1 Tax=Trametes versicolor (strain FP-101664) TaxID=717944 RepID=UPI0004623E64|nr:uncharacterized protein TRAVEDRAFT_30321 [Trametes versicolor FP-101664 SS1]EIW55482.1 hypothetical protein TRAVEDRAFT_30321 [Trametes versicolor FP-101664 SS1]